MLKSIPTHDFSPPDHNYYHDHANQAVYYIKEGLINRHSLQTNKSDSIAIAPPSGLVPASADQILPKMVGITGEAIISAAGTVATSVNSSECILHTTVPIRDGSKWQFHSPQSLEHLSMGVCKVQNQQPCQFELIKFNSSSARTVTFCVEGNQVKAWVNGTKPSKNHSRKVEMESGDKWFACVKLARKGAAVVFNPFGIPQQDKPYWPFAETPKTAPQNKPEGKPQPKQKPKLNSLLQLDDNRMLLIWQNNQSKVIIRSKTGQFIFGGASIIGDTIFGLIQQTEYQQLKKWGDCIFAYCQTYQVRGIFQWIVYLLALLQTRPNASIEELLLTKLAVLRPYLHHFDLYIPNLIPSSEYDTSYLSQSRQWFIGNSTSPAIPSSLLTNTSNHLKLEGKMISFSCNYILTKQQGQIYLYSISDQINQVMRVNYLNEIVPQKQVSTTFAEQSSSSIHTLLANCLHKEIKQQQVYMVNETYVKEMVNDYKIKEEHAKMGLEATGNVDDALVWLALPHQERSQLAKSPKKEQQKQASHNIRMVELDQKTFSCLLLLIDSTIYLVGPSAQTLSNGVYRSQNEYIALHSLKHQQNLSHLNLAEWYSKTHPKLHIQDSHQIASSQYKQIVCFDKLAGHVYVVAVKDDEMMYRREVKIRIETVFGSSSAVGLADEEVLDYFVEAEGIRHTANGQIICPQNLQTSSYEKGTTAVLNNKLFTNNPPIQPNTHLDFTIQLPLNLTPPTASNEYVALVVQHGPPGCNMNYPICSILYPKNTFLANYPHEVKLRNLHGKMMNIQQVVIERISDKKNANEVKEGYIVFSNYKRTSQKYAFVFGQKENRLEIHIQDSEYWKFITIVPKFNDVKKLPYEIGFVGAKGVTISHEDYTDKLRTALADSLGISEGDVSAVEEASQQEFRVIAKGQDKQLKTSNPKAAITKQPIPVCHHQQQQSIESIDNLPPSKIISLLTKREKALIAQLQLIKSSKISFKDWSQIDINKLIQSVLFFPKINKEAHYKLLINRIWESQFAKDYLNGLCQDLIGPVVVPYYFLNTLIGKLKTQTLINNIKKCVQRIAKDSPKMPKKSAYLLTQHKFYSKYYFDQIQPLASTSSKIFEEDVIRSQIVVHKRDISRKYVVKFDGNYSVGNMLLRFQKSLIPLRVFFRVYAVGKGTTKLVSKGKILEHQWQQITKYPSKPQVQQMFGVNTSTLNSYGQPLNINAQYLQIQLTFSESGIISTTSEPQTNMDIVPQFYGFKIGGGQKYEQIEQQFKFNETDLFFIANLSLCQTKLIKYSINGNFSYQLNYYTPVIEDSAIIQQRLKEKVQSAQYSTVPALQKKYLQAAAFYDRMPCLDYLYTLAMLIFNELEKRKVQLDAKICEEIFSKIIKEKEGPIKSAAFKAVSHEINLLIKSLQYLDNYTPNFKNVSFTQKNLYAVLDLSNTQLCTSLSKLVLKGIDYSQKWAQFLIKIVHVVGNHEEIIEYIVPHSWQNSKPILEYFNNIPPQTFTNKFLPMLQTQQLSKYILVLNKNGMIDNYKLDLLVDHLIKRSPEKIDLDIVSILFKQDNINWDHLEKVIDVCGEAADMIINQYLESPQCQILAIQQPYLLNLAAKSQKYSEQLAEFLTNIYSKSPITYKRAIACILPNCAKLHYDIIEPMSDYLVKECHFGGVEGVKLATQQDLFSLWIANQVFKRIQHVFGKDELPNEQALIEWYLYNNGYEVVSTLPANRSPGLQIVKELSNSIFTLLQNSQSPTIIKIYNTLKTTIKNSKSMSLSSKHIFMNQMHKGASDLLKNTISPGNLAKVLVGQNPMLPTIINQLKENTLKENQEGGKWSNVRQQDITEEFNYEGEGEIKDITANRIGAKTSLIKIAIGKPFVLKCDKQKQISKLVLGFMVNDTNCVLPASVELYGGCAAKMDKIADLREVEDQHYLVYGVRVFAANVNNLKNNINTKKVEKVEVRMREPMLCSVSDIMENIQKTKKTSFYNLSFIQITSYEPQPTCEPNYTQLHLTLLSLLSQPKYRVDLKQILKSKHFDQKLELIIHVLNNLLPNRDIENLLIALNEEGENVLEHIIKNRNANHQLIRKLLSNTINCQQIEKVLVYALENFQQKYVDIVVKSVRMADYAFRAKKQASIKKNSDMIDQLLGRYENTKNMKSLYHKLITSLLTVPALFTYDYTKIVKHIWAKDNRSEFYPLIASILSYHGPLLELFATQKYTTQLMDELFLIMSHNCSNNSAANDPYNQIYLLSTLSTNEANKKLILKDEFPLKLVKSLRSSTTLLLKYPHKTMKYLISVFQSTCIQSNCQNSFSQNLIYLMTSLNDFDSSHHSYFIHEFFFPLINAFNGVPVVFVFAGKQKCYQQVTDVLREKPIRSSSKVVTFDGQYYEQIEEIGQNYHNSCILIQQKERNAFIYKIHNKQCKDIRTSTKLAHTFTQKKLVLTLQNQQKQKITSEKYKCYKLCTSIKDNYLTNQILINMKNPKVLLQKYWSNLPIHNSTFQNVYLLPVQMNVQDILKQVTIGGFRIESQAISEVFVQNNAGQKLDHSTKLSDLMKGQKLPIVRLTIEANDIFKNSTIQKLANPSQVQIPTFIPQQTIFKSFEQKKGLQKLIKVLVGSIKNWKNDEQSKIWLQYVKQLESYSCFPVFSSIYMNKQENVELLFNLLLGLPEKQDNKKWIAKEKTSVKFLYEIVKDVFKVEGQQAESIRNYALKSGFYATMLDRLHLITKEPKRERVQDEEQEDLELPVMERKQTQQFKDKLKKRKGVGYGTDSSSNQKWDISGQEEARKEQSEQVLGLLKILESFLGAKGFVPPKEIINQTFESALLPILESCLRGGSLLQISKYAELIQGELNFITILAKSKDLVALLVEIPKYYEPKQPQSIHSLLKTLNNTSQIFLSCLTGSVSEKLSQEIAKSIIETYEAVNNSVSSYISHKPDEAQQKKILQLPLAKKYPILMKDLRFDYVDMKDKNNKISKHHYSSNFQPNHKSPSQKTIRLAQQLADVSHALPIDHTNAIYVRCDKERVDFMQALIMGSNGTPYGHGAYLFDIYFEDSYPNNPPKVNLTTTGNGQIRFNPNLYACGKVCLSLLGTWRGSAMENWDPKVSTLLQVLVSIQSIIMSEEIYFNEPGFEHEQGTVEGEKKNQAYANIVRYGNVKYAMIENIKNPPKGFESIIRRHFYLKKDQILEETKRFLRLAEKNEASYTGLISDHNYNWCNTFKKSKTEYKTMLQKAVKELEVELNKLPEPTSKDLIEQQATKKQKEVKIKIQSKEGDLQTIDVTYDKNKKVNYQLMDINDEKVKDRWSRYIGAMGIQAVMKQSKANILLFGLGALGVEIAKNIILSGCRQFSICDQAVTQWKDLSGQFFLSEDDVNQPRLESTLYKLQELNNYVKVDSFKFQEDNLQPLKNYNIVILTEKTLSEQLKINKYCNQNNILFMSCDCYGPYGSIFNDFGQDFEVVDKNGEETVEVMLEDISCAENGVVTLIKGQKHPFEDGEAVRIDGVKGMAKGQGSINGSIHTITVINQFSFKIGNTTEYSAYEGNGTARNMKLPIKISFKSLEKSVEQRNIDANLEYYDFTKSTNNTILHECFKALSKFIEKQKRLPKTWKHNDADTFINLVKQVKPELEAEEIKYVKMFSFTCGGTFAPLCAFYGGLAAQQAFKGITGKYTPINQYFYSDYKEVIQDLPENVDQWKDISYQQQESRFEGIRSIVGAELFEKIQHARVFLIGSGAIGCQLLKNYAMINLATGEGKDLKAGSIIVTDPDHIETSNLNRQFLFRQKHLRKPKSVTAAASVTQMNPYLNGKIKAKLDKICEETKDIFSNEFFEQLTIVTNALDNVQARQYVDIRCVQNKVPLLESGTLSSKGHVQVILPYLTQSYGSKADPAEDGEIPHCTLKMFPQQTLHCVQWARDIFGKQFTLKPKALNKLLETQKNFVPVSSDLSMLKESFSMIENRPANFDDAIYQATKLFFKFYRNDIMQLLFTYPLDAKTKDGKPFWKLPKRPPTPILEINPEDELHNTFITSYAVLLCKIFGIPYDLDFRNDKKRIELTKKCLTMKIDPFVPSDKAAKEMASEVDKDQNEEEETTSENQAENQIKDNENNEIQIFKKFQEVLKEIQQSEEKIVVTAEQFEKDEDSNGHIDLIYSMANLRSQNYKLQKMDWITTKIKAGRITPALSTTTSCIAALQTIELIKYLKKCKLEQMRNSFINLAVPIFQFGEPGEVEKIKIHEDLVTNVWQRWQVGPLKLNDLTVSSFINAIETKFKIIVKIISLCQGGQLYSDLVLGLQSKKAEKQTHLKKKLTDVLSQQMNMLQVKNFIDFTLVLAVGDTLAKHAPTVRLLLQK